MPRYVITTRREMQANTLTRSARDIASNIPGIRIVAAADPHAITADMSIFVAGILRTRYSDTITIEPETRGGLSQ